MKKCFSTGSIKLGAVLLTAALLSACGHGRYSPYANSGNTTGPYYKVGEPYKVGGTTYTPREQPNYDEVGMASWYGSDFHDRLTANGDVFDKNSLTAAHRTLPLPSMVRVTNEDNGRTIILMVNDRGPFSKGRILDVSERAAEILGFHDKGLAKVRVQFLPGQTRRLLAQLNAPKGNMNPLKTAQADFGDMGEQPANADDNASEAKLDNLPLPDIFNVDLPGAKQRVGDAAPAAGKAAGQQVADNGGKNGPIEVAPRQDESGDNAAASQEDDWSWLKEQPQDATESDTKAADAAQAEEAPAKAKPEKVAEKKVAAPKVEKVKVAEVPAQKAVEPTEKPVKAMVKAETPEPEAKTTDADELPEKLPPSKDTDEKQADASDAVDMKDKVVLDKNDPHYVPTVYYVQAGAFRLEQNAARAVDSLAMFGDANSKALQVDGGDIYRVRLGPIYREEQAKETLARVVKMGYADAVVVTTP